jgi:hypothetical protein
MTEGTMGNGMEGDIRELRQSVGRIDREGCGHREAHDKELGNIWSEIGKEKANREAWTVKIVILVVSIVVGSMLANVYATSAVVEKVMSRALAAQVMPRR